MLDLKFDRKALRSIERAEDWLIKRDVAASERLLAEIKWTCELLREFPLIGAVVPNTSLRVHVARRYRYRIIYRVTDMAVEIRDVLHPKRSR